MRQLKRFVHQPMLLLFILTSVIIISTNEIDFPPIIDSDDIAYYSSTNDIDGLYWALTNIFDRSERNTNLNSIVHKLPQSTVARGGGSSYTTEYKLKMDLEQAEYIVKESRYASSEVKQYFKDEVIPIYKQVLLRIPPLESLEKTGGLYAFRKVDYDAGIHRVYNKALHVPNVDAKDNDLLRSLADDELSQISSDWNDKGIVVIDNILSQSTLSSIHSILLESTIFYQTKMPHKFGGYAGSYIDDGMHSKIMMQLAFKLKKYIPHIMKQHDLKYMWAYKYDERYNGIQTHADQAAVNVNIWLTPDDANLDKESGGLVIFTAKPPTDWDFEMYNMNTEMVDELLLKPTNYANVTVPYKQNRAVIFDSALFHHTDKFRFRKGYKNRRINLTLLYGDMQLNTHPETEL